MLLQNDTQIKKKSLNVKQILATILNLISPMAIWVAVLISVVAFFTYEFLIVLISFAYLLYLVKKNSFSLTACFHFCFYLNIGLLAVYYFQVEMIPTLFMKYISPILLTSILIKIKDFKFFGLDRWMKRLKGFLYSLVSKRIDKKFLHPIMFLVFTSVFSSLLFGQLNLYMGVFIVIFIFSLIVNKDKTNNIFYYSIVLTLIYAILTILLFKDGFSLLLSNPLFFIEIEYVSIITSLLMVITYTLSLNDAQKPSQEKTLKEVAD